MQTLNDTFDVLVIVSLGNTPKFHLKMNVKILYTAIVKIDYDLNMNSSVCNFVCNWHSPGIFRT